jgi:hypothetical protein
MYGTTNYRKDINNGGKEQGRTQGKGAGAVGLQPLKPPKPKFKKHGFCTYYIKSFT